MHARTIIAIFAGTMFNAGVAPAQTYPYKPMRIVTSEAGGPADLASRLLAQGMSGSMGQQLIVDNRPSGVIPGEIVAKAPSDGYTLLVYGPPLWIGPLLQKTPYDTLRDFIPVSNLGSSPSILVVTPSLPVRSVKEMITLAKAKPGELNAASFAVGGGTYLATELFKAMAGVNIVSVNYKGTGPALNDLISGQVQLVILPPTAVLPHIKSGRLRALATTSAQPSALAPGLPTIASDLPGYESGVIYGMFVPAKTPPAITDRLNREVIRVLNQAEVKEKLLNTGIEVVASSPEQFSATIKSDIERTRKIIQAAGIKPE